MQEFDETSTLIHPTAGLSINDNNEEESTKVNELTPVAGQVKKPKTWWRFLIVYGLTLVMVLARSCDTVLYVRLTYEIQNYM